MSESRKSGHKREREPETEERPPVDPLRSLVTALLNLGDPHAKISFEEELQLVCQDIKSLWAVECSTITESLVECVLGLPHKTSKYVLLIGMMYRDQREAATAVVNSICSAFLAEDKPWWLMGQLLRVFSELSTIRVVSLQSLISVIDSYVLLLPNQNAVHSLIYGLPFSFKLLSLEHSAYLEKIVESIKQALSHGELLSVFQLILQQCDSSPLVRLSVVDELSDATIDLTLPVTMQFSHQATHVPPASVLEASTVFNEKFVASWEQYVCYRFVSHIFSCTSFNPRKCCELMFSCIPDSIGFAEKVSAQFLFGALADRVIRMDAEFILIAACRQSKLFPSALARCLFKLVDTMENGALDHFYIRSLSSWFALHLSTFDFKWPWDEWQSVSAVTEYNDKVMFLTFSFEYLGRLSYFEKLRSSVPPFLYHLLPPQPSPSPLSQEDAQFQSIVSDIKSKKASSDILQILQTSNEGMKLQFFEAILYVGSKSFSHVTVLLERYMECLKYIWSSSSECSMKLLSVLSHFWCNHIQNIELVILKLFELDISDSRLYSSWASNELESSVNESTMPLAKALMTFYPSSLLLNASVAINHSEVATSIDLIQENIVAEKQVLNTISAFITSLRLL